MTKDGLLSTLILLALHGLLTGCNTQSSIRPMGIPLPSSSSSSSSPSSGIPAPQSESPGGRQGTGTGQQSAGTSAEREKNTAGIGENPGQNQGQQSSAGAGETGGNRDTAATNGQEPDKAQGRTGSSGTSGTSGKTDDEILAEALEELAGRRTRQPQTTPGQNSDRPATGNSDTATSEAAGTASRPSSLTGGTGTLENSSGTSPGPMGTAARSASPTGGNGSLYGELDRRFAEFDDLILSKRAAVTEQANAEGATGGTGDDSYGEGEDPLQTAMIDENQSAAGTDNRQPGGSGGSGGGNNTQRPDGNRPEFELPADIGPGQDDDIIARQLREAAMKEQDPELRDKLWNEYRKYKKDMQATR